MQLDHILLLQAEDELQSYGGYNNHHDLFMLTLISIKISQLVEQAGNDFPYHVNMGICPIINAA